MRWLLFPLLLLAIPAAALLWRRVFPLRCPRCGVRGLRQTNWMLATVVVDGRRAPDSWTDYKCTACGATFRRHLGRGLEPRPGLSDAAAILYGELSTWPTKGRMAEILETAGLRVTVGRYAIRVEDCAHFVFEEYGGDLGPPRIDADADSVEALKLDAARVSPALGRAGVRHRFEVYDAQRVLCGYFHHDWPAPEVGPFSKDVRRLPLGCRQVQLPPLLHLRSHGGIDGDVEEVLGAHERRS